MGGVQQGLPNRIPPVGDSRELLKDATMNQGQIRKMPSSIEISFGKFGARASEVPWPLPRSQGSLSIELCILKGTRGGLHITAQLNPIGGEIGVLVLVWGGGSARRPPQQGAQGGAQSPKNESGAEKANYSFNSNFVLVICVECEENDRTLCSTYTWIRIPLQGHCVGASL